MTKILLVGATGLVGRTVLEKALSDPRIDHVVAPTRRPLESYAKLTNALVDFTNLPGESGWWAVDAVICTLGTTRAKAGSDAAFRAIDFDLPLAVATLAKRHGASCFALNSSMGADAESRWLYPRTKGEIEQALRALAFRSLTIVRPGLIGGEREDFRAAERGATIVLKALGPLLPRRYRISSASIIADALIESAIAGEPGTHVVESDRLTGD